jgi:hypothetical protein
VCTRRTLHTAQDALDTKWVMQQWVARGYPTPKAVLKAVKVAALTGPELAAQPIMREVLRVAVPVSSSSNADGYAKQPAKGKRGGSKKGAGSKKGFSSR